MEYGVSFVKEYPKFGELFEKLFFKRELDEWYKEKCKEKYQLPLEIYQLKTELPIEEFRITEKAFPSTSVHIVLSKINLEDGGVITPYLQMVVSKLIPVYYLFPRYTLKLKDSQTEGEIWGPAQTIDFMKTEIQVNKIMESKDYIRLQEGYDLYDKICDWDQLPDCKPVGRSFTVEQAVFKDPLGLCEECPK